jgi:hypothetical protein
VCFSPGRDSEYICIYTQTWALYPGSRYTYSTLPPPPPPGKAFTSPPPPIVSESGRRKEILNSLVRKVFYDKGCPSALLYIYMQLDRKVVLPVTALLEAFSLFSFAYFRLKFFRRNCTEILRFRARSFIYVEEISALSTLQYDFSRL